MGTPGATVRFLGGDRLLWPLVGLAQRTWTPGGQVLRASVGSALQGDVLITSCTYNTEDRRLATVVSHPNVPPAPCRRAWAPLSAPLSGCGPLGGFTHLTQGLAEHPTWAVRPSAWPEGLC